MKSLRLLPHRTTQALQLMTGIYFLISSAAKATTPNQFAVQIRAYGIITNPTLLLTVATAVICCEWLLGASLTLFHHPNKIRNRLLCLTLLVLLAFTSLITWAWLVHDLEECGCFGKLISMRPAWSIMKNTLLMLLIITALAIRPSQDSKAISTRHKMTILATSLLVPIAAILISPGTYASIKKITNEPEILSDIHFTHHERYIDLSKGEWFLAMLSPECPHCIAAISHINELANDKNLPEVVGLMPESDNAPGDFAQEHATVFPLHTLKPLTFYKFIGESPPVYVLLSDGQILKTWTGQPPKPIDILIETE